MPTLTKVAIEVIKILLDGEWHNFDHLVLAAGKVIDPQKASKIKWHGVYVSIDSGRREIVRDVLKSPCERNKIEKRKVDNHLEYRISNWEWARNTLTFAGETLSSLPPIPEAIRLNAKSYNMLSFVKQGI